METIKSKCGEIPKTVLYAGAAAGALAVIAIIVILSVVLTLPKNSSSSSKDAPASITSANPTSICGNGGSIYLYGDHFQQDTKVNLTSDAAGTTYPVTVIYLNSTVIEIQIAEGSVPMGYYNVTVQNGKYTTDSTVSVEIRSYVFVLYMDPPSSYSGVSLSATVYTSGLNTDPATVTLVSGNDTYVLSTNSSTPDKLNVVIPSGLSSGYWAVTVEAQDGCASVLKDAIYITSTLNMSINFVTPAYAYNGDYTSVTIKGTDPTPVNFTSFQQVPTVYISPSNNSLGSLVTKLRAIDFADDLTLTAVVPSGLTPTDYNLIVVNPDGSVGVLNNAITVVNTPTPVIYSISPNSLKTSRTALVTGANFDISGISMWMNCIAPNTTTVLTGTVTVNTTSLTSTSVSAYFNIGSYTDGTVCTVVVQNKNNASFEFSAISKKSSSGNLQGWTKDKSLNVPRRGHVQVGGRPTPSSRFLYVIGGDNGTLSSAMTTVEAATMSPFGSLGSWAVYPDSALPYPLTFAGVAVINNFIYIAGGHNGTNVTNGLLRAQILDPLNTPLATVSLDIDQLTPSNLTGGFWYYQVSAIFDIDDLVNPGGESLPGELVTIRLPSLSGLMLSLEWTSVPSAVGYKIYRTPSANLTPQDLQLLATIDDPNNRTYVDTGASTVNGTYPLPSGSLGKWRLYNTTLNTERYMHAMLASVNPLNSNQHFIYMMGGKNSTNGYLDTYEYVTVNVSSESVQEVSAFTKGISKMTSPRASLGAVLITNSDENSVSTTENWVFILPGDSTNGVNSPNVDNHFLNTSTGDLGALVINGNTPSGSFSGYCALASSGFIYLFGGKSGASSQGAAAQICNPSVSSCGSSRIPTLVSGAWNNEGTSMSNARLYHACSQESPFFFATGGFDGSKILSSVDRSTQ